MPTSPISAQTTSDQTARIWRLSSWLLGLMVLVPLLVILSAWGEIDREIWSHLIDTQLPRLLGNTAILVFGVGAGVTLLGVGLAWLTALCEFPGRRWLDWALMLPFALPSYVLAFVFLGTLDFDGPAQAVLRDLFDLPGSWAVDVRTPVGVVLVMTLVLYPYVYMLTRLAFLGQGQSVQEASRVLGLSAGRTFWRVTLPMARPAIVAGLSLAMMETLADFGAVAVFNFDTFTTAIYKAWFGFFDLATAAQLASVLLLLVLSGLLAERGLRGRARYEQGRGRGQRRLRLTGWRAWLASGAAGLVFTLAFVIPVAQLLGWAWESRADLDGRYGDLLGHTALLGLVAALAIVAGAFVLAFTQRYHGDRGTRLAVRLGTLGYALPGSVLAVGVMLSLTWLDQRIADGLEMLLGGEQQLILSGSVFALVLAYFARFLAAGFGPVDSALERIRPSIRDAARTLGADSRTLIRRIYLPILSPGLLTAGLLALVDVMKEMPATLLLRPFGWDTLAVRIFELTSEGEWERAALPAMALVLVGLIPVVLLVRRSSRGHD